MITQLVAAQTTETMCLAPQNNSICYCRGSMLLFFLLWHWEDLQIGKRVFWYSTDCSQGLSIPLPPLPPEIERQVHTGYETSQYQGNSCKQVASCKITLENMVLYFLFTVFPQAGALYRHKGAAAHSSNNLVSYTNVWVHVTEFKGWGRWSSFAFVCSKC